MDFFGLLCSGVQYTNLDTGLTALLEQRPVNCVLIIVILSESFEDDEKSFVFCILELRGNREILYADLLYFMHFLSLQDARKQIYKSYLIY